jgi:hypothetical protein
LHLCGAPRRDPVLTRRRGEERNPRGISVRHGRRSDACFGGTLQFVWCTAKRSCSHPEARRRKELTKVVGETGKGNGCANRRPGGPGYEDKTGHGGVSSRERVGMTTRWSGVSMRQAASSLRSCPRGNRRPDVARRRQAESEGVDRPRSTEGTSTHGTTGREPMEPEPLRAGGRNGLHPTRLLGTGLEQGHHFRVGLGAQHPVHLLRIVEQVRQL